MAGVSEAVPLEVHPVEAVESVEAVVAMGSMILLEAEAVVAMESIAVVGHRDEVRRSGSSEMVTCPDEV